MGITTLTIHGNTYTSYASLAEADAYLAVDPTRGAAWCALSETTRNSHLVAATRNLDRLGYTGAKVSDSQANEWPRTGATESGVAVGDTDVPQSLEDACCVLAGSIALDAEAGNAGTTGSNIKAVGAGSARVEFFRPTTGGPLPDATALALVSGLLAVPTGSYGLASGVDGVSSFGDVYDPDRDAFS